MPLALAAAACDTVTSPRVRQAPAVARPALGAAWSGRRFESEIHGLANLTRYLDELALAGSVTVVVDGEAAAYRAVVYDYVNVPSALPQARETAWCGRNARALILWRDAGALPFIAVIAEDYSAPVSVAPLGRCPVNPRPGAFPPHVILHQPDDEEAWVGVAGEVRVDAGTVSRRATPCDTAMMWNAVTWLGAMPCVATTHAVAGRVEVARGGEWLWGWRPGAPAPRPPAAGLLDRLLGRAREVRILPAVVPGFRFTEVCDDASRRHEARYCGFR